MRREKKTKIIATLGPASSSAAMVTALFKAGVDVFRLNMSHGNHEDKSALIKTIRAVEADVGRPIAIMADLQGPKLRIGQFKQDSVILKNNATFTLDLDETLGDAGRVCLPHKEIFDVLVAGTSILLNDGKVRLAVEECDGKTATCRVEVGGELSSRKGVNLPGVILPVASMTAKDHKDLDFALAHGVDWVALSFVQRGLDVAAVRKLVGKRAAILAKIEKPSAVTHLDEIIELADGVMVARGDLGVEEPVENVPGIQKHVIQKARIAGKPVVVATQMLESMISSPTPTRAEVSDVATAVHDGADAIMLSAESAMGQYPVEAVQVMNRVAVRTESEPTYLANLEKEVLNRKATTEDAISAAARQAGATLNVKAIVTFTTSGATALRAARERPQPPIIAMTPSIKVARKLAIGWGMHTVKTRDVDSFEEMLDKSKRIAVREGFAVSGDRIVVTAGVPFGTPGATNVMHIAWINDADEKAAKQNKRK